MRVASIKLWASLLLILIITVPALGQQGDRVEVKYLGAINYYAFTRVVFDTGGERPEGFKINYDPIERQVVLYPESGTLSLSFAPAAPAGDIVREISFTEGAGPTGIVISLTSVAALGYRVSYLSEPGRIVLDFYDRAKSQAAGFLPLIRPVRTVAIDPGHGGRAFGSSKMEGMPEKELDMDVALRLRNVLTARGFKVVMTRDGDAELNPSDRAGAANAARADLFISIHASGSYGRKGMGKAFYTLDAGDLNSEGKSRGPLVWSEQNAPYLPDSLRLARALIADMGAEKGRQPVLHQARLSGFDGLAMPAVMAELGDLDDPDQAQQLSDDAYRNKIAVKLANGIGDFARGVVH
jgi:N-acetylmuramoyl-L-alanine amidase